MQRSDRPNRGIASFHQDHCFLQTHSSQIGPLRTHFPLPLSLLLLLLLLFLLRYFHSPQPQCQYRAPRGSCSPSPAAFYHWCFRVCKPIPLSTLGPHPHGQKTDPCLKKHVHVDIVCTLHKNPVWIIVSDRNPKYITWSGSSCGSPYRRDKSKGLKLRIQQVTAAARSAVALKPSSIILFFSNRNGLSSIVCDKLKDEFGAIEFQLDFPALDFNFDLSKEAGEWTNVLVARTYQEACAFEIKVSDARNAVLSSESDVKDSCLGEAAATEKDPSVSIEHTEFCRAFSNLISRMEFYSLYLKNGESAQVGSLLG